MERSLARKEFGLALDGSGCVEEAMSAADYKR
jgi:hypothetical protein